MDLLSVFHKYRLKYAVAVLTILLLAAVGLHASVYRIFTPENIRSRLQQSIAHTHTGKSRLMRTFSAGSCPGRPSS